MSCFLQFMEVQGPSFRESFLPLFKFEAYITSHLYQLSSRNALSRSLRYLNNATTKWYKNMYLGKRLHHNTTIIISYISRNVTAKNVRKFSHLALSRKRQSYPRILNPVHGIHVTLSDLGLGWTRKGRQQIEIGLKPQIIEFETRVNSERLLKRKQLPQRTQLVDQTTVRQATNR